MLNKGGEIVESEQRFLIWDKYEQIAMHFNGIADSSKDASLGSGCDGRYCCGFLDHAISQ
jgi:hypothetical protein